MSYRLACVAVALYLVIPEIDHLRELGGIEPVAGEHLGPVLPHVSAKLGC